jgi:hypothetical protein
MAKQASDYYFFYSLNDDIFWVVEKEYWHNEGAINDQSFDGALDAFLPKGMTEAGESQFRYYVGGWQQGRDAMIAAGFTEMDDPEAK